MKTRILALASASLFVSFVSTGSSVQFAGSVTAYTPGSGVSVPYQNASVALGAPTTFIGYQDADPFNPPFQSSHILGLGTGGSLTLAFNAPILNDPVNPFSLDFIIFGHAGFNDTDWPNGVADGSLFTGGTADVRVSVSADGSLFYRLNPAFTPIVDGLYPTDASGNPFLPVDPSLTAADFNGQNLAGIRSLYNGSAGGAGFDIGWALDENDQNIELSSIGYIRLETLSGTAFIDAVSAVPEPSVLSLAFLSGLGLLTWKRRTNA